MPEPTLTVVVPVFNGAATLPRCLSALAEALPAGAEVIVVDDGSTDETRALAEGDPSRPRVLHHETNQGTSAARNTGWRAAASPLVAFVDADMVIEPDALRVLVGVLEGHPELLGANGTVSLDLDPHLPDPSAVTEFVNTSLAWQLSRHGERVSSAFTAICVFRRAVLEEMGGWDERWFSRYADDVSTRFVLPPESLAYVGAARGAHLKRVPLRGLLKHRFNVGFFFVSSVAANRDRAEGRAILDLRYPLNTAAALATAGGAGVALALGPFGLLLAPLSVVPAGMLVAANAPFCAWVARQRGPRRSAEAFLLSAMEGYAYGAGVVAGAGRLLRRRLQPSSQDATHG